MANEYGEIEQLVNDVTSLDTARMTLRWALERLNNIEKEKSDLKKNLALAEETSRSLQLKEATLRDAVDSRSKTLEEKEDFYTKLEATMSLLGEGKLDIQQLLKKEAKLDTLRRSLENEYQEKFEELDHNQRAVIERWNARLLETESQYAGRLAEAQVKYDGLRAGLETDYQSRITALQASFRSKETELTARISALEASTRDKDHKLESRRAELETQYLSQKREAEENYRKLKNMLEAGFEEKLRSADSDHEAQVLSLETSWKTERSRLLEEQRVRDEQFQTAQARIKEIENNFAEQQEAHHNELLKMIGEQEAAFRAQLLELEREKAAKEEMVRELSSRLEKRASDWEKEKAQLEAEFGRRLADADRAAGERISLAERDYADKKSELVAALAAGRAGFEREFQARLDSERRALAGEKELLAAEREIREAALAAAAQNVKKLETMLASSREEHHQELMEKLRSGEASFREKLSGFEAEKLSYNETINRLTDELRLRDAALLDEKKKIAAEFDAKAAIYEARLASLEAAFEEKRRNYEDKLAVLTDKLEEAAKASALERENFKNELARISAESGALAEQRTATIRAEYEGRKAELEKEFESRYGDRVKALEIEKARVNEALAEREAQLKVSYSRAAELDASLDGLRRAAAEERKVLSAGFEARIGENAAVIRAEYEGRRAELEKEFEARYGDRVKALEIEKARVNEALAERETQLKASYAKAAELDAALDALRRAAAEEKVELSRGYSEEMRRTVKQLEEDAKFRENELCSAVGVLREELAERDRLLGKEREKLVDELANASVDAHARSEERAAAVRHDYEQRLAALEAAAEERVRSLKTVLAEKEELFEKASVDRAAAESALKAAFEGERTAWLQEKEKVASEFETKAARLEAEYAARREALEKETAGRAEALNAEAAEKIEFERRNWHAERSRFENLLAENSGNFRKSQKEIEELSAAVRASAEQNSAREARFNRELMEARSNYEKEISFRISDAVSVQTANLMDALEAAKARNAELSDIAMENENVIRALKTDAEELRRDFEDRLRNADSETLAARRAELEDMFNRRQARLEENFTVLKHELEADFEARRGEADITSKVRNERLEEEVKNLKNELEKFRAAEEAANKRAASIFAEMLAAGEAAQLEMMKLQKDHSEELNSVIEETVRRMTESAEEKMRLTQQELVKTQESNKDEVHMLEEAFTSEKERMLEELARRDKYIESCDMKIQGLEMDIMRYRQNASGELVKQIAEQDERFREIVREEKARRDIREKAFEEELARTRTTGEARVTQLENLLAAKEKLMAEEDRVYRQKQLELDAMHSEMNLRVNKFNEELFVQKQALGEKEKVLNDYRLKLEKEYAIKAAELENMKAELSRAIMDYKNKKQAGI